MAKTSGSFYQFALGGQVPKATSAKHAHCNDQFGGCEGDPECIKKAVTCDKHALAEIKTLDFEADVTEVLARVSRAIEHLHQACGGHWKGVKL